jgi:ComF family protein
MLGRVIRAIGSLLIERRCMVCGEEVDAKMGDICIRCRYNIPTTGYWLKEENPVKEHFAGIIPVVHASSFITFREDSPWRSLIHQFKYSGKWRIAYDLGVWFGSELKSSGLYDDVDIVVPIPLHPLKMIKRGYNQSSYIAEGIAKSLGVDTSLRAVRRTRNNPSQTRRAFKDRWQNVDNLFEVRNTRKLQGRHILLVDDVLTTGATITSCAEAILRVIPDARISIATLAVTQRLTQVR